MKTQIILESKSSNMLHAKIVLLCLVFIFSLATSTKGLAATQVSKDGIVWTFDTDYTVGQFANGDYYVIRPVKINSISATGGSIVNPMPQKQSYDSRMAGSFSIAYVNPVTAPLTLQPNSSLVSTNLANIGDAGVTNLNTNMEAGLNPN